MRIEEEEGRLFMAANVAAVGAYTLDDVGHDNTMVEVGLHAEDTDHSFSTLHGTEDGNEHGTGDSDARESVFVNFDGASGVEFDGPVQGDGIDLKPFSVDPFGSADRDEVIDSVMEALDRRFRDEEVVFTNEKPSDTDAFSTIHVAPDATDFLGDDSIVAIAEKIDVGNHDRSDNAFVNSLAVFEESEASDVDRCADDLAAVIAHEFEHLRGARHDEANKSDESALDAVAASRLPTTPNLTTASALSSTEVDLDWSSTYYEDGYRVIAWDGQSARVIGRTGQNDTDYRARGLSPGKLYYFRIEAYNSTGSRSSAWKSVRTQSSTLEAPTLRYATALSGNEVRLTWTNVANESGYRVQQWTNTGWKVIATRSRNETSHTVRGLNPGTNYYFRVTAYNGSTEKASNYKSVRTQSSTLEAPTLRYATALSGNEVRLTWTNVANESGYRVQQWTNTGWKVIATRSRNETSHTVRGLNPGTYYYFRVTAYNGSTEKASNYKSVRTQSSTLETPTLRYATATSATEVRLTWTNIRNETGYRVRQWTGRESKIVATLSRDHTSFTVGGLQPNTYYNFQVSAYNGSTEKYSNWIGVRTNALSGLDTVSNSGVQLRNKIDSFNVVTNPAYQPRNGKPYCNVFAADVAAAVGRELPNGKYPWHDGLYYSANRLYNWLPNQGRNYGWRETTAREAQSAANEGRFAVGVWYNSYGHGHIAVVRPHDWNGTYSDHNGPMITQAGGRNYSATTVLTGFGRTSGIRYYVV